MTARTALQGCHCCVGPFGLVFTVATEGQAVQHCLAPGIAVTAKLGALRVRNVQLSTSFFVLLECSLLFYCSALSHGAGAHFFISVIQCAVQLTPK